jgi:hypothetical protein
LRSRSHATAARASTGANRAISSDPLDAFQHLLLDLEEYGSDFLGGTDDCLLRRIDDALALPSKRFGPPDRASDHFLGSTRSAVMKFLESLVFGKFKKGPVLERGRSLPLLFGLANRICTPEDIRSTTSKSGSILYAAALG